MVRDIKERYAATPFAFYFSTQSRGSDDLNSSETARSGRYYLGGKVETLKDIEARNDPEEAILRQNMKGNKWDRVITNTNSWKVTQPFTEDDIILDYTVPRKETTK
jgi:hypothetical protein